MGKVAVNKSVTKVAVNDGITTVTLSPSRTTLTLREIPIEHVWHFLSTWQITQVVLEVT